MIGQLGRRAVEGAVLAFALYAFAFVPLGKHTGLQHLRRILGTAEAEAAKEELEQAGKRLFGELLKPEQGRPTPARGRPELPELPPANLRSLPVEESSQWGIPESTASDASP